MNDLRTLKWSIFSRLSAGRLSGFEFGTPPFPARAAPGSGDYAHAYAQAGRSDKLEEMSSPFDASSRFDGMSLHETGRPPEKTPLVRTSLPNKDKECCRSVYGCLKGEGEGPSLPEPDVPLSHDQYELQECFPCVYKPLHYFLLDRLPFLRWGLQYNVRWLVADVVAGLTVGLMVVPQALAYAKIANLQLKVRPSTCSY